MTGWRYVNVIFESEWCECVHPPQSHDAGVGCTETDCDCLADWQFDVQDAVPSMQVWPVEALEREMEAEKCGIARSQ